MATLICNATGNLTGAATFAAAETGASALTLIRNTTTSIASATTVTSSSFTVTNAKVIDAVLLWVNTVGTVGTGTFKVDLQKGGVSQASVTVNKSDLPDSTNAIPVPVLFKLTSTATGDGGANWTIVITTTSGTGSATITINIATSTTTNYTRALRTTTAATPAAGDDLYIIGELTGAGTHTSRTVTMNSTATTAYGSAAVNSTTVAGGGVHISSYGTLSCGVAASTNYVFRVAGDAIVYWQGTLNFGSSGNEIPRNSTAIFELLLAGSAGDFLFIFYDNSVVNAYGLSRTSGKNINKCLLTSNVSAAGTTWNVSADTGWLSTDQVAVPSTTRTYTEAELVTLSGNAGASSFTSSGGAASAHSGTSPTQAELGLVTRNVIFRSTSATNVTGIYIKALATVTFSWVNITNFAFTSGQARKRGIEIECAAQGATNPKSFTYCSMTNTVSNGLYIGPNGGVSVNLTFSNNILYNFANGQGHIQLLSGSLGDWTFDNNLMIKGSGAWMNFADVSGTITNNTCASTNSQGINITGGTTIGTFSDNTVHSNNSIGFQPSASFLAGNFTNLKCWRNSGTGISSSGTSPDLYWVSPTVFGNATTNWAASNDVLNILGGSISADTTFSLNQGITVNANMQLNTANLDMSGTGGIFSPHTLTDISLPTSTAVRGVMTNCKFGAATPISKTNWTTYSYIGLEKYGQTAADHRCELTYGQLKTDSTFYNTASPSMRMTPNSATVKLESAPRFTARGMEVAVANGGTVNVGVYLRKSAVGDGAAYNGNQPRLIQRANAALGQNADVVLATYSASTGSWNQLTATSSTATDDGA